MSVILPHNWQAREYQKPLWGYLRRGGTRAVACWHRRAGKDEVALHWACIAAFKRVATYWHLLPEASQARKAIWDAVNPHTGKRRIDEAFPNELIETRREQEMLIKFKNGSTWQVVGSDNYNSLVGSPPAGVVYSEWALANPLSWGYIRPILAENGGWALFIYTPRGRNHGADLFEAAQDNPAWFCQRLTADETGIFTAEHLAKERQEYIEENGRKAGSALFRQEYYCSFDAAILGSVYGEWVETAQAEGRIKTGLYDPTLPVQTIWDLGYGDATAIWFYQLALGEIRFIDYWEDTGRDVKQCCEVLLGRNIKIESLSDETSAVLKWRFDGDNEYAHRKDYNYLVHAFPHDAAYKLQTARGRSFAQQAYEFGIKGIVIQPTNQETAIQATRKLFPQFWFDGERCKAGLNVLRNYQFAYDQNTQSFKKEPKHDWSSHGSKALELVGRSNVNTLKLPQEPEKPRFLHEITSNELFFPEKSSITHRERI